VSTPVAKSRESTIVQIDGTWVSVPSGINAIEAARMQGKEVPHFCYHPKLQVAGNCRMCLIEVGLPKSGTDKKPILGADGFPEIGWSPRPQIGCATVVTEGMAFRTDSPALREARKGVMEFLLANHPLDCPICDQAGECRLQEHASDHGQASGRFAEDKVKKPKRVPIGPRVMLDNERCVLCSRCIRFMRDVANDDCLGFVSRGSHTCLTTHPARQLESNYSLNTVDICPVGALTSQDFRFKMRVWFLKETPSICVSCGTGCNTIIGSREGKIYRQTPRNNEHVNQCWMCDDGRLNFKDLHSPDRVLTPTVRVRGEVFKTDWEDGFAQIAKLIKDIKPSEIAIVASARMTNEELFITKKIMGVLGRDTVTADIVPRQQKADHLLVCSDGNPNSRGARLLGVSQNGVRLPTITGGINAGKYKAVFCFREDLSAIGVTPEALASIPLLVVTGMIRTPTVEAATFFFPGAGFAEKSGTMINVRDRLQRLNSAIPIPSGACDDWLILAKILKAVGGECPESFDALFGQMVQSVQAFGGLSWADIGSGGVPLHLE